MSFYLSCNFSTQQKKKVLYRVKHFFEVLVLLLRATTKTKQSLVSKAVILGSKYEPWIHDEYYLGKDKQSIKSHSNGKKKEKVRKNMNGFWPVLVGLVQLGWETSCWSEEEEEEEIERKCGIVSFESIFGRHSRRETTVGKDDSMGIIGNSDILENCHRTLVFFFLDFTTWTYHIWRSAMPLSFLPCSSSYVLRSVWITYFTKN